MFKSSLLEKAIIYATEKHQGQKRKNSKADDYIMHPLEVMQILHDNGASDELTLIGAVLHDTIEDTSATYEEICGQFGNEVGDVVQEVSDDKTLPKLVRKKRQVSEIAKKSFSARMIKIADKMSNTKDLLIDPPKNWTPVDINGYMLWSKQVCENARSIGDTPSKLETAVRKHFEDLGISNSNYDLIAYYESME